VLTVDAVTAAYGGIVATRAASLTVARGRIVALIGPNGAGKTTLLNTVSGLVRPKSGSVTFQGGVITGKAPHRIARLGLVQVPEGRQVLGPLSVRENLELGRAAAAGRAGRLETDLRAVYRLFPRLEERATQRAGSLSGGEQQMLAIGRALMGRPAILLLDEPSLGLAPVMVGQVFAALAQLNEDGMTMLLVEQNAKRALELASYAYVMERGRIVRQGPTAALRRDPQIVAHYLGGS
jgi:branched-chain amino acid transport system ATP-binding protein